MLADKYMFVSTRTNLEVEGELRNRILVQSQIDKRSFKKELLVLVEEALERREKRK